MISSIGNRGFRPTTDQQASGACLGFYWKTTSPSPWSRYWIPTTTFAKESARLCATLIVPNFWGSFMNIQLRQSPTAAPARACKGSATLHACPQHNTCCKYLYVQQILKNTANTFICNKYCEYYCPQALQLGETSSPQLCIALECSAE